MLIATDNFLAQASELIKKYNLDRIYNQKKYSIANTPLSYRQANTLDKDKLLNDERESGKGWRKFSLKELVFIEIVSELKKFGIKHEQLRQLWASFFKEPENIMEPSLEPDKGDAEIAISGVLGGVEVALCLDSKGDVFYFDQKNLTRFIQSEEPLIRVSLNVVVKKIIKLIVDEALPLDDSMKKLIVETS